eukprot:3954664-Ditylum_brightwellii.AAC.1
MNITRSSRTITGSAVKDLVRLSTEQLKTLKDNYLIALLQDLVLLDKDDVDSLPGNDSDTFLIRRKLSMVATFLRKGDTLSSTTTMSKVMQWNGGTQSTSGTTT